ncbi:MULTISPECIES: putative quinol monooxygenase [Crateriforma]|uniref:Antibiotic biosynthesis monooxygenase n=1 Tax=Crateriforma conspicua TaxID=2527996 RepID=A0A5C6FYD2_9PLAN|nr:MULTISPECIES: antibiotic biosynthesis monooxygenase [Crateriforma]TWU66033.1 Antibiotic biosynthesis monooxygenase [Crateriforma conspicua]
MFQAVLRVVAPHEMRGEFIDVFWGLTGPTACVRGCRGCRVFREVEDGDAITYWMQWDSRDALDEHFRSERFRRLLPYIEMSTEPPEVEVTRVERLGGIEMVLTAINSRLS